MRGPTDHSSEFLVRLSRIWSTRKHKTKRMVIFFPPLTGMARCNLQPISKIDRLCAKKYISRIGMQIDTPQHTHTHTNALRFLWEIYKNKRNLCKYIMFLFFYFMVIIFCYSIGTVAKKSWDSVVWIEFKQLYIIIVGAIRKFLHIIAVLPYWYCLKLSVRFDFGLRLLILHVNHLIYHPL